MSFSTKWYYLKETFTSLKRNSLMSIASVTTVALSILVLGLFLTMVLNVNNLAQYLENQVQVTVYMSDAATSVQRRQVEQQLKTTRGVMEVKGVTKEEALQNFKKRLREQEKLLDALGEDNPFPYSFEVQVDKPERIQEIVPQIEKMPGVETAKFGQEVVEHLFQLTRILRLGGIFLIIMLAIATLFIISNTIRITVFARRREVSIMKYVGATNWFIRWPFVIEGMIIGLVAGGLAFLAEWGLYTELYSVAGGVIPYFEILPFESLKWLVLAVFAGAGALFGIGGSVTSIRKFMDV